MSVGDNVKKHSPLVITLIIYFFFFLLTLILSIKLNDGNLIYVLDDAYIHLAFCKNIVLNHVAGVSKFVPASVSSSPLWTLTLAVLFGAYGVNDVYPIILNFIFALILILYLYKIAKSYITSPLFISIILVFTFCYSFFFLTLFCGMEHILFSLVLVMYLNYSTKYLCDKDNSYKEKQHFIFLLLTFLLVSIRYEGLFIIFPVIILVVFKKRIIFALLISLSGILPIILYGIWSYYNCGDFFSSTSYKIFSLKGFSPKIWDGINEYFTALAADNWIHIIKIVLSMGLPLFLSVRISRIKQTFWNSFFIMSFLYSVMVLTQAIFTSIFVFRYITPLIIVGILINGVVAYEYFKTYKLFNKIIQNKILYVIIILLLLIKLYLNINPVLISTRNTYEQQYQMGLFLKEYYNSESIAANDIGVINYIADINCTDLFGLGSREIIKLRAMNKLDAKSINDICLRNNVKIAVIYESWFKTQGGLPPSWYKAGEWIIKDNIICGDDSVSFFAVSPDEKSLLIDNLHSFSNKLPKTVIQSGEYIQPNK